MLACTGWLDGGGGSGGEAGRARGGAEVGTLPGPEGEVLSHRAHVVDGGSVGEDVDVSAMGVILARSQTVGLHLVVTHRTLPSTGLGLRGEEEGADRGEGCFGVE